jgi:MFS family permease
MLLSLPGGMAVGVLDVAAPAFADDRGAAAAAAVPLAALAAGSVAGALLYGARRWTLPAPARFVRLHVLYAAALGVAALAPSVPVLAVLLLGAGLVLGPITATTFGLLGDIAPRATSTEALTWLIAAFSSGAAAGSAIAGAVHEATSSRGAFATACAAALVTLGLLALRRRTLDAAPHLGSPPPPAASTT